MDRFVEGLMTIEFRGHLRKNPSLWQDVLVLSKDNLTPGLLYIYINMHTHCNLHCGGGGGGGGCGCIFVVAGGVIACGCGCMLW